MAEAKKRRGPRPAGERLSRLLVMLPWLMERGEVPVAERFEVFVGPLELANGYHELVDPEALRARNVQNNALRADDGRPIPAGFSRRRSPKSCRSVASRS